MANAELTPEQSTEHALALFNLADQLALLLIKYPEPLRERLLEQFITSARSMMATYEAFQRGQKHMSLSKTLMIEEMEVEQALQEAQERGDEVAATRLRRELADVQAARRDWSDKLAQIAGKQP